MDSFCDRLEWRVTNATGQHLSVVVTLRDGTVLIGEDGPVYGDGWGEIAYPVGATYEVRFARTTYTGMQDTVCGGSLPPARPPHTTIIPRLPSTGLSADAIATIVFVAGALLIIGLSMVFGGRRGD